MGTRTNALRYINQFTEIFTEEGRKNVKITHRVPNQQPRVTFTAGMRATMTAAAQAAQAQKRLQLQVEQLRLVQVEVRRQEEVEEPLKPPYSSPVP